VLLAFGGVTCLVFIVTVGLAASSAVLAANDTSLSSCNSGASPEQQIAACTVLIQSGSYHGQDLARAYFSRAVGYLRNQATDSAIEDLNAGLALDPSNTTALFNRAVGYESEADPDRALKDYDAAIKLNPDYLKALTNRAAIYFEQGRFDEAIEDETRVIAPIQRTRRLWQCGAGAMPEKATSPSPLPISTKLSG
jgi:tetratricopeptide (TPR) repeat protein